MIVEDQSELIAFLGRPETYPGVAGRIERFDTHGAVVFLAGDRAYKLKRAVRFPYMDFSTPARRAEVCAAEIRINRRTAPDLYLGVAAVERGPAGGLVLGAVREPEAMAAAGPVVDWLVVMRRFDTDGLFDRMAARGALTPALMDSLADAIAAFHGAAEVRSAGGGRAPLAASAADNLAMMRAAGAGLFADADLDRLQSLWAAALDADGPLLDRRRAEGRVRLCHGDLHLRNICLIDGRPVLFDAIEFDESLAVIDVWYDVAFLLMDMAHRGLRDLANRVFNRYLARTGDVGGLAALPLFLSLRAGIRAHVGASAADAQPRAEAAAAQRAEAGAYLDLALDLMTQPPPRLIAVGGLSGTGKSTLAGALAPAVGGVPGAVHLRSDVLRKLLWGVDPLTPLPPAAYTPEMSRRVYDALLDQARAALAGGHSVVADAVWARPDERAALAAVAAEAGAAFDGLWLDAPLSRLEARVTARRADASDATADVVRRQAGYELGEIDWTRLDAGGSPDKLRVAARAALGL